MTASKELAKLLQLENLRTRQLAAIRDRILYALVEATPEDVESAQQTSVFVEQNPLKHRRSSI